jgi:outer membrane protein assembly factor BamB
VYNGKVIIGENEGDGATPSAPGARGVVQAFNESSGSRLWAFYSMPPSPINSTNQGFYKNTWGTNGTTGCMCGGGDVWNVPAVDPHTGIIYFGTGNPSPVSEPSVIAPDSAHTDLYTDSIIALYSNNGTMKWAYQVIPGSYLDHDNGMPVQLFNTTINGVPTEVVGDGGKAGYYVELNAATGKLIFKFAAGIHLNDNANATSTGIVVYPGDNGGINTFSSYNPLTNMIYTIASNRGNTCILNMTTGNVRCPGVKLPANSTLYAINASTGSVVWTFNMTGSSSGLPGGWATGVSTTNYLVFTADGNHHYYALDARNGQILWNYPQPLGNNKGPYWSWGPPSITDGAVFETTLGNTTTGVLEAFTPNSAIPVVVQTATGVGSPVTSATVSFSSSVIAGDLIVVGVTHNLSSNITSITDSLGDSFTKDIDQIAQGGYQGIWFTTAKSTGSDSVTVTVSSFGAIYLNLYELSGTALKFSTSSGSGSGTILSVTSFAPPTGSFVVAEVFGGGGSLSPSTGFTCLGCGFSAWLGQSSYAPNWGGGSTTVPWTMPLSNTWGEVAATFESAITTTTAYTSSSSSMTTYTTTSTSSSMTTYTTTSTSTSTSYTHSTSTYSSTTYSSLTSTSVIVIPGNTSNNSAANNVLGLLPILGVAAVVISLSVIFALRKKG